MHGGRGVSVALNKWNGDAISKRIEEASKRAINKIMSECVIDAKQHHPGFINDTGTAEGSIRIVHFADRANFFRRLWSGTSVSGTWGSVDCNYFIWLELKRGSPLRMSADRNYPHLGSYIQQYMA